MLVFFFFFSSRRRHTRCLSDWSSDVCSSDLERGVSGDSGASQRGIRRNRELTKRRIAERLPVRIQFSDGGRGHFAVSGGSGSGSGCGNTRRGSPLGRKRLGWPGMFPAGVGFGGFGGFDSGGLTVSFASGWVSRMGSFGNSWRRALRRLKSSMARRYRRSVWAWERRKRVKLLEDLTKIGAALSF